MSLLTVEQQFAAALIADAAVFAQVANRVYRVQLPQGVAYPAISFQRISTTRNYVNAAGGKQGNFGRMRMQVDVWDNHASSGNATALLAYNVMQVIAGTNFAGTHVQAANGLVSQAEHVEANTQPPLFRQRMDFDLFFADNT